MFNDVIDVQCSLRATLQMAGVFNDSKRGLLQIAGSQQAPSPGPRRCCERALRRTCAPLLTTVHGPGSWEQARAEALFAFWRIILAYVRASCCHSITRLDLQ